MHFDQRLINHYVQRHLSNLMHEAKCDRGGKVERAIRRGKSILDKAAADGSERTVQWEHTRVTMEGNIVKTQNN